MAREYHLENSQPTSNQRRPEHKRDDGWIRDFLHRGVVAHIATRWDSQPFVTPSTYVYDETSHRLVFHSNLIGRVRANIERHPEVCVEVSEVGRLLPSNTAIEFSIQYRSVIVFGTASIVDDLPEQRRLMHSLIAKYFPRLEPGVNYRAATDAELRRTSVYQVAIGSWSGKENWPDRAEQSQEWPALDTKLLQD